MALFNQLYLIKGKHAEMVRDIVNKLGGNYECRNIDVFYISVIFGLWQNRMAEIDNSAVEPAKIDPEQMVRYNDEIDYLFKLVMLSDKKYCISAKQRSDKAFRYKAELEESQKDEMHFTKVMLGGLEFFYEQVIENTNSKDDIFSNMKDLVQNYSENTENITEDTLRAIV